MAFDKSIAAATSASYGNRVTTVKFLRNDKEVQRRQIAGLPLGVASKWDEAGRNTLAVASYWQPRVDIWQELAPAEDAADLLEFQLEHIFGVNAENPKNPDKPLSYRIFPRRPKPSHADVQRAQAVTWGPNGDLWVTRNADGRLFVLEPPLSKGFKWRHTRTHKLTRLLIHAVYFLNGTDTLWTIESRLDQMDNGEWLVVCYHYNRDEHRFSRGYKEPRCVPYMTYGITMRPGDNAFWYGADIRGPRETGIYRDAELVIPLSGVSVNGLAFLKDGSAIAMSYGESAVGVTDAQGQPSERIYVPAELINSRLAKLYLA